MLHPSLSVVTLRCAERPAESRKATVADNNGFIFMIFLVTGMFYMPQDKTLTAAISSFCLYLYDTCGIRRTAAMRYGDFQTVGILREGTAVVAFHTEQSDLADLSCQP